MSQRKIIELLREKPHTLSFEFFPPKTDKGMKQTYRTSDELVELGADFFSVTYGAGGASTRGSLELVEGLLQRHDVPVMHHLTCFQHTFDRIREELERMKAVGVRNIMALRGDPPVDNPEFEPGPDKAHYGFELVKLIREYGDWFCIGVPGFPEAHPRAATVNLDTTVLRVKAESGADFVVTQLFFDNRMYFDYVKRVRADGIKLPVVPGLLPVTDYDRLVTFCERCGATVTDSVRRVFEPIRGDKEATLEAGIDFAVRQARELLEGGAPGLHFYCLNRPEPVRSIVDRLGDALDRS